MGGYLRGVFKRVFRGVFRGIFRGIIVVYKSRVFNVKFIFGFVVVSIIVRYI